MTSPTLESLSRHQTKREAVSALCQALGRRCDAIDADFLDRLYEDLLSCEEGAGGQAYFRAQDVSTVHGDRRRLLYPPIFFNGQPANFPAVDLSVPLVSDNPAYRLARIANGYVGMLYDAPVIFDESLALEREFSSRYSLLNRYVDGGSSIDFANAEKVDADVFVMLDDIGGLNFCHWLCDWMPRLSAIGETGLKPFVLTLPIVAPWQQTLLEALGFSRESCLSLAPFSALKARNVHVPSNITHIHHPAFKGAPWVYEYLRKHLLGRSHANLGRRIYLSRADATYRRILNEDALKEYLASLGFVAFVAADYDVLDQASIFNNAEVVVSLHGAGLAHVTFCNPQTRLLEICPVRHATPAFWVLATTLGLRYATYICSDYVETPVHLQDDSYIDLADFRERVEAYLRYA